MNNKHLTFEERSIIEDLLNKGENIHKIAQKLGRPDSSIAREIQRNRFICNTATREKCCYQFRSAACPVVNLCGRGKCRRMSCSDCDDYCNDKCPEYKPYLCPKLTKSPFVCNGCKEHPCHIGTFSARYRYQLSPYTFITSNSSQTTSIFI